MQTGTKYGLDKNIYTKAITVDSDFSSESQLNI